MDDELRINFAEVEGQKDFSPIPPSRQQVTVTDWQQGEVTGEDSINKGALKLTFELSVQGGQYEGRRIWDTFTVVQNSFWKLKAFLGACSQDVEREWSVAELLDICPDLLGEDLEVKLGVQAARVDQRTGNEYSARNKVQAYFPAGSSNSTSKTLAGSDKMLP